MNKVTVKTKSGDIECKITSDLDISPQSEYAVKGLATIQILCLKQSNSKDPKFESLLGILNDCASRIETLYLERNVNPMEFYED